jgi:predicted phosphodiesterase
MRIAVIADIHGNLTAFEAVLEDLRSVRPDIVVHGGDLVVNGSSPVEVVDQVRSLGWPGVCGNTDELLWRPERIDELALRAPGRQVLRRVLFHQTGPATREALGDARLAWLAGLPASWAHDDIIVMHAAPDDLWRAPLAGAADHELEEVYSGVSGRLIVYAHIHHSFVRQLPHRTFANTGSVSLPYDGDPRASYLLITDGVPAIRRVEYDIAREVRALETRGYPQAQWLASILTSARYQPPAAD